MRVARSIVGSLGLWLCLICYAFADDSTRALTIHMQHGGQHALMVDVADTEEKRQAGLMHRPALAQNTGMLFVYESSQLVHMWMKNTYIPLDVLFISSDGTVMHIVEHMQPHDLTPHSSIHPIHYALEMNAGTVKQYGVTIGDSVTFKET